MRAFPRARKMQRMKARKVNRKRNRVGRPAIYTEACKLSLHIPRRLRDRLRKCADREKRSLNATIIAILEGALKKEKSI